ncbi:MAG: hypothetical protein V2A75_09660 [Pseudomonadota bacterium]
MMKQWIKKSLFLLIFILIFIGSFNYIMDPFWCFNQQHHFNQFQKEFNERQQKSYKIYFSQENYDTLLIGSSRTTYTNYHDFEPKRVFNYAVSGIWPKEYDIFIDFAINDLHQPIKTIIIGADFSSYLTNKDSHYSRSKEIINNTKSPIYRWKTLLSYDSLTISVRSFRNTFTLAPNVAYYNSDNIKIRPKNTPDKLNETQYSVLEYAKSGHLSQPDPEFHSIMQDLKKKYSNQQFILYTTPVSLPLMKTMIQVGHYPYYEDWLRELVSIYGRVYHFMYINPVTMNYYENFSDSNHPYPATNTLIVKKLMSKNTNDLNTTFGMILTADNIDDQLKKLKILNHIDNK